MFPGRWVTSSKHWFLEWPDFCVLFIFIGIDHRDVELGGLILNSNSPRTFYIQTRNLRIFLSAVCTKIWDSVFSCCHVIFNLQFYSLIMHCWNRSWWFCTWYPVLNDRLHALCIFVVFDLFTFVFCPHFLSTGYCQTDFVVCNLISVTDWPQIGQWTNLWANLRSLSYFLFQCCYKIRSLLSRVGFFMHTYLVKLWSFCFFTVYSSTKKRIGIFFLFFKAIF